jgi:crotonobetainyl-CoA:carnitine CoA-transferase CaiB-like acyl-CoA transferase
MDASSLPLAGVRVLDLSRVLAGPMCAQILGDLGAEVIKVESPGKGDDTRDWGIRVGKTETAYFNSANRNKASICLDLGSPEGQEIARSIAAKSDIVIQNFKFGGAEKFNLGYEQLKAIKPDIIYCSVSGYDRTGPEAGRPGYDLVVQGEAGLMGMNGEGGQGPLKFGVAVVDMFTGMYSAQAILAALYERKSTGRGRNIEMALFDCGMMITAYYGLEALLLAKDPPKWGNAHPSIVPYGVFDAQDGPLVVAVGNNGQYVRFVREVIDRPDLAEDERFKTNLGRGQNRPALMEQIDRELKSRPRALLLERLKKAGIPCGEVFGLYEAMTSQRARDGGLVRDLPHPDAGTTTVLSPPFRFDGQRLPVRRGPPQLGMDTDAILKGLAGVSDARLAELRTKGVV